jgi:hypothetical protein
VNLARNYGRSVSICTLVVVGIAAAPENNVTALTGADTAHAGTGLRLQPQASALMARCIRRYRALKSYTTIVETSVGPVATGRELVQYRDPGLMKVTSFDRAGKIRWVSFYTQDHMLALERVNDSWEWTSDFVGAEKSPELSRARLRNEFLGNPLFTSLLTGVFPTWRHRPALEALSLGTTTVFKGVPVRTVVLNFAESQYWHSQTTYNCFLGRDDYLLRGAAIEEKHDSGLEVRGLFTYSAIRANPSLPPGLFTLVPPSGARHVKAVSAPRVNVKIGSRCLPIIAHDVDGKALSLNQFRGRVVLIQFSRLWDGCDQDMLDLQATYRRCHDLGLDVLGVSTGETLDDIKAFDQRHWVPWRQICDGFWDGPLLTEFNVPVLPFYVLLDRRGNVVAVGQSCRALEASIDASMTMP